MPNGFLASDVGATLSCEVRIRPDLLTRIMASWDAYAAYPQHDHPNLTAYWRTHRAYISIIRTGQDVVRVSGQSGFYFPGHSYSGLDTVNALVALVRLGFPSTPPFIKKQRWWSLPSRWNYDWLRALDHVRAVQKEPAAQRELCTITEIGSGTGILALAFKRLYPAVQYTCIDLPETLHLAACFLAAALPDATFVFPKEFREGKSHAADVTFVDSELTGRIPVASQDLYINTDSMQEMSRPMIQQYFMLMRRTLMGPRLFYQSNRESKPMDGAMIRPTEFPWTDGDRHLFFRENDFMARNVVKRHKWHLPYVLLARRKHLRSLTVLA